MKINYELTPTVPIFLELHNKALKQLTFCFKSNQFRYNKEIELLSSQLNHNLQYVIESISIRLDQTDKNKLQNFIKELNKTREIDDLTIVDNAIKFYSILLEIIKKYAIDSDLITFNPNRA